MGTLSFRRSLWLDGARFPEVDVGEDVGFLNAVIQGCACSNILPGGGMVYMRHLGGHNTWSWRNESVGMDARGRRMRRVDRPGFLPSETDSKCIRAEASLVRRVEEARALRTYGGSRRNLRLLAWRDFKASFSTLPARCTDAASALGECPVEEKKEELRRMLVDGAGPPPTAAAPPPTASPPPIPLSVDSVEPQSRHDSPGPTPLPLLECDVVVVGHGLAGASAAATAALLYPEGTVCTVGPEPEMSTSAASGNGWLLLPDVPEDDVVPLLNELEALAGRSGVPFNRTRAEHIVRTAAEAELFIADAAGVSFEAVNAYADPHVSVCSDVSCACVDGLREVDAVGAYPCSGARDVANSWYVASGCCGHADPVSQPLQSSEWSTWPAYYHLNGLLDGKVKWATNGESVAACSNKNLATLELLTRLLSHVDETVTGTVTDVAYADGAWLLWGGWVGGGILTRLRFACRQVAS